MKQHQTEYVDGLHRRIKALEEGVCRFNCRTARENWLAGHWYANGQPSDPAYKEEAEIHYVQWKRRQKTA